MRFALVAAIQLAGIASGALASEDRHDNGKGFPIKEIVSFGDSLTDTGVVAELTKFGTPIPSDAYYKGRFTNGKVWIEYLVEEEDVELKNFAAGGATTSDELVQGWVGGKFGEPLQNGKIQPVPGVDTQITNYLKSEWKDDKCPVGKRDKRLYTIFVGANDDFDNQILGLGKEASYFASAQLNEWKLLAAAGAGNIMPIVLPNFGPFYFNYSSTIDQLIVKFKKSFTFVRIAKFEVPFTVFDATSYEPDLIPDPAYCCKDCFNGLPPKGNATLCSNRVAEQNKYLTWDGIHPTTIVHKQIAVEVSAFIRQNFPCLKDCNDD
jgi:phospholipase/lecithinase/hemolysin